MEELSEPPTLFIRVPVTSEEFALVTSLLAEDGLPIDDYVRSCTYRRRSTRSRS
jgi:hypothetical protein